MENKVASVNSTMNELNTLSDDLYEALMDSESKDVVIICKTLIKSLHDIKRSHEEEI